MAERFTGRYSPDAGGQPEDPAAPFRDTRPRRVNGFARAMFLLPVPLLLSGIGEIFQADIIGMVLELGSFAVLTLGVWLLNEGLRAEELFNHRKVARAPAFPRKIFGAVATGLGVAGAAFAGDLGLGFVSGLVMGGFATAAQLVAFGLDPLRAKGMTGTDALDADRVAKAVDRAEELVSGLLDAAKRIGDKGLEARIERLAANARALFRSVENDPRDLPRARKFMSVYLMGARDATAKFADIYSRGKSSDAREKYEALLGDLEASFAAQREKLLIENRSDLDVEIEVLRERLQREGVIART